MVLDTSTSRERERPSSLLGTFAASTKKNRDETVNEGKRMPFSDVWHVALYVTAAFVTPLLLQGVTGYPPGPLTWLSVGQAFVSSDPRSAYQYVAALALWGTLAVRLVLQAGRLRAARAATRFESFAYAAVLSGCAVCVATSALVARDYLYVPYGVVSGLLLAYYMATCASMPAGVSDAAQRSVLTFCALIEISSVTNVQDPAVPALEHLGASVHDETAVAANVLIVVILANVGASARVHRLYLFGMAVGMLVLARDVPMAEGTRVQDLVLGPVGIMYVVQFVTYTLSLTALSLALCQDDSG